MVDSEHFFTRMYRAHFTYVRDMLVKYGVPSRDSEDTAHELFVAVWERLRCYDRKRPIKCWLFSFIVRFARNYRRRSRYDREELHGFLCWIADEASSAEEKVDVYGDREIAARAVERLAPACQVVLLMQADGWTMPEITATLGIPLDTGYARLRRARRQACRYALSAKRGCVPREGHTRHRGDTDRCDTPYHGGRF